jgi:hypothetical protein
VRQICQLSYGSSVAGIACCAKVVSRPLHATGTEELNACVPDCAPSQASDYPVSIQMHGSRVTSAGGLHVYSYVTITYSGTMPTLKAGEAGGLVTQTQSHSRTIKMDSSRD